MILRVPFVTVRFLFARLHDARYLVMFPNIYVLLSFRPLDDGRDKRVAVHANSSSPSGMDFIPLYHAHSNITQSDSISCNMFSAE